MNPTKVNRNELLKKLNLKDHSKQNDKPTQIEEVNQDENSKVIPSHDIELDINLQAILPPTSVDHINYTYKINHILKNPEVTSFKTDKLIHLCIFNIIEQSQSEPFILYLLNKDVNSNILYFPHFNTRENIYTQATEHNKELFKEWNILPTFKGQTEDDNNVYLFYEVKHNYILENLYYKDIWWWVAIFEIVNIRKILNFHIHNSVFELFYNNSLLMSLFDEKNNKIESPYIGYCGSYYTKISFISVFGLPKQRPEMQLGPYYYFHTYKGAGRNAIWTSTRKQETMNGQDIALHDGGLHKRGGLVRFAIFGKKIKFLLNRETDEDDDSQITKELINNKEKITVSNFTQSTLKLRDVYGKWADNHDLVYVGNILIKSETYRNRKLDILFAARDFNQQMPLTYHYVDTTEFSKIEGATNRKNIPFDFQDYDIE